MDPAALIDWGRRELRDLPWRETRDPWAILVAEVMLQQTQTARVVPAWQAFLERFGDPAACAAAPLGDLIRQWQGLGYPRRARNLHGAAIRIAQDHQGRVPDDLEALLGLPGIGPYTARAVLAFAFERDVAVVDTNIARVLARIRGERLTATVVQDLADDLVPDGAGWIWNQALIDLGATICRTTPCCERCPIRTGCAWQLTGRPDPDPAIGSAKVSAAQTRFEGSRRQARGRVLRTLVDGARPADVLESSHGPEVVASLVDDGLVVREADGTVRLP